MYVVKTLYPVDCYEFTMFGKTPGRQRTDTADPVTDYTLTIREQHPCRRSKRTYSVCLCSSCQAR
jgi:hypothetical protein